MIKCIRTNSENKDFRKLVEELDAELRIVDGVDHSFYAQFNKIVGIKYVVVAYDEDQPVGCGAIKTYSPDAMEVKRMYVSSARRVEGIATAILKELEQWTVELNCSMCVLETGIKQPEAIGLYKKTGYKIIRNYGQYENVKISVCFAKILISN